MMDEQPFLDALGELKKSHPPSVGELKLIAHESSPLFSGEFYDEFLHGSVRVETKSALETLCWFERGDVPECFTFSLPKPAVWESTQDGKFIPKGKSGEIAQEFAAFCDEMTAVQKARNGRGLDRAHLQNSYDAAEKALRKREQALEEVHDGIRRVLSAWVVAAAHDAFGQWPSSAERLHSQWGGDLRQLQLKRLELTGNSSHDEHYYRQMEMRVERAPPQANLISQTRLLWDLATHLKDRVDCPDPFRATLQRLTTTLELPKVLVRSTYGGLLYYIHRSIAPARRMKRLRYEHLAYAYLLRSDALNRSLTSQKDAALPYADESMQTATNALFSANAKWHRWGRFIVNRAVELERQGVTKRTEQAKEISQYLAGKRKKELRQMGVAPAGFGPKQLSRVLKFHRDVGFDPE